MIISDHLTNGMKVSIIVSFTALFFVAWSCGTDSPIEDEPDPEPTGEEVWNHLQQGNYQNSWELWPGTEELYDGENAHMEPLLFTTYLNNIALDALMSGDDIFPDGSIIVKEAYAPEDSTFEAITSMYKVDGYNPDANDWFWLMNSPDGMIGAEGRVQMCIDCHAGAADSDYIFQEFPE
jgi:hypothetical protein